MSSRVAQWECRRGRQDELEKTGTGEATILVHDREGLYDPSNAGSPYYGDLDGAQVALSLRNPVTDTWHSRFRGHVEEYSYSLSPTQQNNEVSIRCVDAFDYLVTAEMAAGVHGFAVPPTVNAGSIFYEAAEVNDRILKLLDHAGWDPAMAIIFSGNVVCKDTVYDSGYSFLAAIQDAADAEFPGVANVYVDALGNIVFHGRHARFDPANVAADAGGSWDWHYWYAGDENAINLFDTPSTPFAQVRPPLTADRSMKMVLNSVLISPEGIEESEIPAQYSSDPTSIGQWGTRSYTATDLLILEHKTNGNTGLQETKLMADYYKANYSQPRTRPRQITFKSLHPDDPRAPATWDLMCRVEISDVIYLYVSNPGGGGFAEEYYVEGVSTLCRPGAPDLDVVEVTLDVSPTAYYETDVFDDA